MNVTLDKAVLDHVDNQFYVTGSSSNSEAVQVKNVGECTIKGEHNRNGCLTDSDLLNCDTASFCNQLDLCDNVETLVHFDKMSSPESFVRSVPPLGPISEDDLRQVELRNQIDSAIDSNPTLDVYAREAALNSSPLKAYVFEAWLTDYEPAARLSLINNLKYGIIIPSLMQSPDVYTFYNHVSASENSKQVSELLAKRVKSGIIAGPFDSPPPGLEVSPMAAIPPKGVSVVRLIHNLSFPYGQSVNSSIDRMHCHVQYETLDDCLCIIRKLGVNALMAKADLADAYNLLGIHYQSFRLLGFTWDKQFYFGKTLPMGSSISCKVFEEMSSAVQWILQTKLGVKEMSHILDDYMFFGSANSSQC